MNCIEKLHALHRTCEPCVAKIIEFGELPEHEKQNFDSYDEKQDYILYCEPCNVFIHLTSDIDETKV